MKSGSKNRIQIKADRIIEKVKAHHDRLGIVELCRRDLAENGIENDE